MIAMQLANLYFLYILLHFFSYTDTDAVYSANAPYAILLYTKNIWQFKTQDNVQI
jgi:hypothetical protein